MRHWSTNCRGTGSRSREPKIPRIRPPAPPPAAPMAAPAPARPATAPTAAPTAAPAAAPTAVFPATLPSGLPAYPAAAAFWRQSSISCWAAAAPTASSCALG
ncbi:MAG: hypothetical protein FJ121_06575 [Deltaproteobacteria bacterium]|nr:hypothetical protein [Deltaproteobacteria bacterium]